MSAQFFNHLLMGMIQLDFALIFLDFLYRRTHPDKNLFALKWSLVHVWIAGQVVLAAMWIFFMFGASLFQLHAGIMAKMHTDRFFIYLALFSLLPQNILLVTLPVFYITVVYREPLSVIGFHFPPLRRDVMKAIGYGVVLLGFGLGFNVLLRIGLHDTLGNRAYSQLVHLNNQLGNGDLVKSGISSPGLWFVMLIAGAVLAPIGEEFFFRGFLYNAAKRRYGVWAGILLSSTIFAVVHGGPLLIPAVFPVGFILAYAYERTGNLWTSIIMHGTFNGLQLLMAIVFKMA